MAISLSEIFMDRGSESDFSGFRSNDYQGEIKVEMIYKAMTVIMRPSNRYIKSGVSGCLQINCFSDLNIGFPLLFSTVRVKFEFIP